MNKKNFNKSFSFVDEKFIEEADPERNVVIKKKHSLSRFAGFAAAAAAVLLLTVAVIKAPDILFNDHEQPKINPESTLQPGFTPGTHTETGKEIIIGGLDIPERSPAPESKNEADNKIYLYDVTDGDFLKDSISVIEMKYNVFQKSGMENKKVTLNKGKEVEVSYEKSIQDDYSNVDIYCSADKAVEVRYDSTTSKILQLQATFEQIGIPDDLTTEESYKEWIINLLSAFGVSNLDNYIFSCQTDVVVKDDKNMWKTKYEGFYSADSEKEKATNRKFFFTKYVKDYPTSDVISVSIMNETKKVLVKLSREDFLKDFDISVTEESIKTRVNDFIKLSINNEKYEMQSSEIKNIKLTKINEEICFIVSTEISLKEKFTDVTIKVLEAFAVYPA